MLPARSLLATILIEDARKPTLSAIYANVFSMICHLCLLWSFFERFLYSIIEYSRRLISSSLPSRKATRCFKPIFRSPNVSLHRFDTCVEASYCFYYQIISLIEDLLSCHLIYLLRFSSMISMRLND